MEKLLNRFGEWLVSKTSDRPSAYSVALLLLGEQVSGLDARIDRMKSSYGYLLGRLEKAEKISDLVRNKPEETVDCVTCGCMVRKSKAVKGKGEIRRSNIRYGACDGSLAGSIIEWLDLPENDFIYYPHYCKRCAPKGKKSEG